MSLGTEVVCLLYERTGNSCAHCFEKEFQWLCVEAINSLDDLLSLSPFTLQSLSSISEKGRELAKEIKKIQLEGLDKKAIWITSSKVSYRNDDCIYQHWLPVDRSRLLGVYDSEIESSWNEILENEYQEFDTLCHATHIDTAAKIFKENNLESHVVQDNSVFSKVPGHPNKDTSVIWFGPARKASIETIDCKYGNVAFFMNTLTGYDGIIVLDEWFWNYYFVEVIDYRCQSACRILATTKTYPHLRPYDPTKKGGPWYYDKKTGKHYCLRDIVRWNGSRGNNGNSLEIMREGKIYQGNMIFCPIKHSSKFIKDSYCRKAMSQNDTALRLYVMYKAYVEIQERPTFLPYYTEEHFKAYFEKSIDEVCRSLSQETTSRDEVTPSTGDEVPSSRPRYEVLPSGHPVSSTSGDNQVPPSISDDSSHLKVMKIIFHMQPILHSSIENSYQKINLIKEIIKKLKREVIEALCRTDDDLRKDIVSLLWKVAADIVQLSNDNNDIIIAVMKIIPQSQRTAVKETTLDHAVCEQGIAQLKV